MKQNNLWKLLRFLNLIKYEHLHKKLKTVWRGILRIYRIAVIRGQVFYTDFKETSYSPYDTDLDMSFRIVLSTKQCIFCNGRAAVHDHFLHFSDHAVSAVECLRFFSPSIYLLSCTRAPASKTCIFPCRRFVGGIMDFMFLSEPDHPIADWDIGNEIVSKDLFFQSTKRFISTDEQTLLHRQALFNDILTVNGISEFLIQLHEKLSEYEPLIKYTANKAGSEENLYRILYPTVYIELVKFIYDTLSPLMCSVSSASMKHLFDLSKNEMTAKEYKQLERYYEKNAAKLRSVRSVTIGINLDALYRPKEAGIIAFNKEEYKSGDLLDRIMKLDFEKDDFHCIAPLTVIDKKLRYQESQQVNYALLKAMGRILDSGLQHCSSRCLKYVKEKLSMYFEMLESLSFIVAAIERIKIFQEKDIPLCFPKISTDRSFHVVSLYDDALSRTKDKKDIVPNTVCLDDTVCCYILTGPNSGGKTVFIHSLAAAQYYFQLGMPIPAKEASLPVCDAIFQISVEKQINANLVGRFEKECISLSDVLKRFTKNSLALIDEAFTSTSAEEAVPIAANFISELCKIGGKCVFITHHHALCEDAPKIAACGHKIGYLHTEAHGEQRTFAVQSGRSEPSSYANNIAKKYGLL